MGSVMSYYTTIFLAQPQAEAEKLVQEVERIDPEFVDEMWQLLNSGSIEVNNLDLSVHPIFLRLSEVTGEEFIVTGVGENLDEDMWARKYVRGHVYIRGLAKRWKRDREGERASRQSLTPQQRKAIEKKLQKLSYEMLEGSSDFLNLFFESATSPAERKRLAELEKELRNIKALVSCQADLTPELGMRLTTWARRLARVLNVPNNYVASSTAEVDDGAVVERIVSAYCCNFEVRIRSLSDNRVMLSIRGPASPLAVHLAKHGLSDVSGDTAEAVKRAHMSDDGFMDLLRELAPHLRRPLIVHSVRDSSDLTTTVLAWHVRPGDTNIQFKRKDLGNYGAQP
jgi:DNA-binding MarR family transcriptional regulator